VTEKELVTQEGDVPVTSMWERVPVESSSLHERARGKVIRMSSCSSSTPQVC